MPETLESNLANLPSEEIGAISCISIKIKREKWSINRTKWRGTVAELQLHVIVRARSCLTRQHTRQNCRYRQHYIHCEISNRSRNVSPKRHELLLVRTTARRRSLVDRKDVYQVCPLECTGQCRVSVTFGDTRRSSFKRENGLGFNDDHSSFSLSLAVTTTFCRGSRGERSSLSSANWNL